MSDTSGDSPSMFSHTKLPEELDTVNELETDTTSSSSEGEIELSLPEKLETGEFPQPSISIESDPEAEIFHDFEENDDFFVIPYGVQESVIEEEEKGEINYSKWMGSLKHLGISNLSLNQIVLPGTHDSGTCNIKSNKPFAPDCPKYARFFSGTMAKFSKTQKKSISTQLNDGIRYFDIRLCILQGETTPYICHNLVSVDVYSVFDEIVNFSKQNPEEIIIVDINHFYAFTPRNHELLIDKIYKKFGKLLVKSERSPTVLLKYLWQFNESIIVIYKNKLAKQFPFLWYAKHTIQSKWFDEREITQLKERIDEHLKNRFRFLYENSNDVKNLRCRYQFHVIQGVLTPNTGMVASNMVTGRENLFSIAQKITPKVTGWILGDWKSEKPNIIIVDHYHIAPFVKNIVQLNVELLKRPKK